ncbi:MAG: DUF418 domain-containing protein [Bacteroidota bacterium]
MTTEQIQPIAPSKRTAIVDMLRGWALLGVVLMNYTDLYYLDRNFKNFHPDLLTKILSNFSGIVFAAKSWTMLSMLFGYGFAVLITNVSNKGINPVKFFTIRMFWLFVLAFVNSAFWFGDILKDYAFMGLILLFFYKIKPKPAFIICVVLLALLPVIQPLVNHIHSTSNDTFMKLFPLYHSASLLNNFKFNLLATYYGEIISPQYAITVHIAMLICFLLGYSAQRVDFFNKLADNKKYIKRVFWYMLLIALVLTVFALFADKMKWTYYKYYNPRYYIVLSIMLFTVAALCWLYIAGKLKRFFSSMEVIGKMTLTNYMTQSVIIFFVFNGAGLGIGSKLPFWFYMVLPISIYIAQVYFSKWWLSRYNYGFVEWIWRQLSYNKRLPLKKVKA